MGAIKIYDEEQAKAVLARAKENPFGVKVGQTWEMMNLENKGQVLIRAVNAKTGFATIVTLEGGRGVRPRDVRLDRFKPTTKGYRLRRDVPPVSTPEPTGNEVTNEDPNSDGAARKEAEAESKRQDEQAKAEERGERALEEPLREG